MPNLAGELTPAIAVYAHIRGRVIVFDDAISSSGSSSSRDEYPISAFASTFMVNSIPTAQMVIPVGKSTETSAKDDVLRARELSDKLKQFRKLHVFLTIDGDFAPGLGWPSENIRVFNGYVSGTSVTRTGEVISVTVQAIHWLSDLDASSALSSALTKATPVGLLLPPHDGAWAVFITDPADPAFEKVETDIWGAGLKNKLISLTKGGSVPGELSCAKDTSQGGGPFLSNDIALPRLDGSADGSFDLKDKIDVPLCALVEQIDLATRGSISEHFTKTIFHATSGGSSILDKLMEAITLFQLAMIVNVDSATIAPMSPCLAAEDPPRHVTIKASEYYSFSPSEPTFRVWRGVAVTGQKLQEFNAYYFNAITGKDDEVTGTTVDDSYGCYMANQDDALPEDYRQRALLGTVQFIPAPQWVLNDTMQGALMLPYVMPTKTPGQNNSMEPEQDELAGPPAPPIADPNDPRVRNAVLAKTLGDEYAKWYYWAYQFVGRTGQLSGKLRFDIAPGSIVRIEDMDGKLYEDPADFGYLYALVTAVQVSVDAMSGQAGTTLTLSHIRRESEKLHGTEKHPLYVNRWVGTVLQRVEMNASTDPTAAARTFVPLPGSHELA